MPNVIYTFEVVPRRLAVYNVDNGGAEIVDLPDRSAPSNPEHVALLKQQAGSGAVWVDDPFQHPHVQQAHAYLAEFAAPRARNLCDSCLLAGLCSVAIAVRATETEATVGSCERYVDRT